jgi:multidrug transporter EmrE-like cation transporter
MTFVFFILALLTEMAGTASLKLSQGFSKLIPSLAMVVFYGLSLTLLSFALRDIAFFTSGFGANVVYAAWAAVGIAVIAVIEKLWKNRAQWVGKDIGPIGTTARMVIGFWLVGSVVYGQLSTQVHPATWALGLVAFPGIMLAWHWWRIRRNAARFEYTSPLSFALSVVPFFALYLTWWYAPAFSVTSDAALIFYGSFMILAGLRSYPGCEILALSNWIFGRSDLIACAPFTPIDHAEQRLEEGQRKAYEGGARKGTV